MLCLLGTVLALPSGASAKGWDYFGHFEGQPKSEVRLRVAKGKKPGAARRMIVYPLNYKEQCDNGKTRVEDGFPMGAPFASPRTYYRHLESYYVVAHGGMSGHPFYEAAGEVAKSGDKVRGYYRVKDDHPPQYSEVTGQLYDPPDCSTDGRLRFIAAPRER